MSPQYTQERDNRHGEDQRYRKARDGLDGQDSRDHSRRHGEWRDKRDEGRGDYLKRTDDEDRDYEDRKYRRERREYDKRARRDDRDSRPRHHSRSPARSSRPSREDEKLQRIHERRQQEALESERDTKALEMERVKNNQRIIEEEARGSAFTRTVDDLILNSRLKSEVRWDDPARYFVDSLKNRKLDYRRP